MTCHEAFRSPRLQVCLGPSPPLPFYLGPSPPLPPQVVLVTSVGADELLFPLNLLWGVLFWKKRAEEALQRSGLDYTIVRPGASFVVATMPRRSTPLVHRGLCALAW